jgi:pyruvate dehydrogenase E2 component (dihydrolipoamide acetyltransferase)
MAIEKIVVPDFGDVQEITVVDVFISAGDKVEVDDSLIALESEKAVMDIPSPFAGVIKEVLVKEEETTVSGDVIALIETGAAEVEETEKTEPSQPPSEDELPSVDKVSEEDQIFHATPSVRGYARKHGIDLSTVIATGPNGRILLEDLQSAEMQGQTTDGQDKEVPQAGVTASEPPLEDFGKYGEVEEFTLGRIQKISGPHLHKSWVTIPHVTHFDEADITELEKFRKEVNSELQEGVPRFSLLVFITKALATVLNEFPFFNCSLVPGGEKVVLKKYYHVGIAVDTPQGLVVPVIKDVDKKGMREIRDELNQLSLKARQGKLTIPDIQGATITISSLGGIGGTGFTPIVNGPQVAILGLSRSFQKPVWDGEKFIPRLTMPFSVSYDHRVIDGAGAARFSRALASHIEDLRRTLL